MAEDFESSLDLIIEQNRVKVRSREKRSLEFKSAADENSIRKCVKTIAAFANSNGGIIVFGIGDRPRILCGCTGFPDESHISNLLQSHLLPSPEFEVIEHTLHGFQIIQLKVKPHARAPVVAIKDLQTSDARNETVLRKGTVYFRRSGQTGPISGEEFISILEKRDQRIRETMMSFIAKGHEVGFQNAAVADFRDSAQEDENVTVWLTESAAKNLNVIDRARIVDTGGSPAYEIRGIINLTSHSERDPRNPMLPKQSADVLRDEIVSCYWSGFPWTAHHLRKAAKHLGFWDRAEGDGINTRADQLTDRNFYFERGRSAVLSFARNAPQDFIQAIASRETIDEWRRRSSETAA